jgi:diaminopimelate epimerase
MTRFLKMHGLGNDFVVFDARKQPVALTRELARAVADRRHGVGCDQVIVIENGHHGFDASMRSINADGGEVESCGNASRCIARLLMEELGRPQVRIDTLGGPLDCRDAGNGNVTVDMGAPRFAWNDVPLAHDVDTKRFPLVVDEATYQVSAVSVGNPHCVIFVDDAEVVPVAEIGQTIEVHAMFPKRTNVEFVTVKDKTHLRMRVWERGVGITDACGTGACATAAAAHRLGLCGREVEILLDGGTLAIALRQGDEHILMTGPASFAFQGELDLRAYA